MLNLQVPVEHSKEVSDCKHLMKTLVMGNCSSSILFSSDAVGSFSYQVFGTLCMIFFFMELPFVSIAYFV